MTKKIKSGFLNLGFMTFSQITARGTSAIKDVLVAYFFGTSVLVDIYFLVMTLPSFFSRFINEPIASLSLPELTKEKDNPLSLLKKLLHYFFGISFFISLIFTLFATVFLTLFRFNDKNYLYTITTVIILMTTVPLATTTQIGISWLSFRKNFKKLSLLCFINPLSGLISFFILAQLIGEWALPVALLFGRLLETFFYLFFAIYPVVFPEKSPQSK